VPFRGAGVRQGGWSTVLPGRFEREPKEASHKGSGIAPTAHLAGTSVSLCDRSGEWLGSCLTSGQFAEKRGCERYKGWSTLRRVRKDVTAARDREKGTDLTTQASVMV